MELLIRGVHLKITFPATCKLLKISSFNSALKRHISFRISYVSGKDRYIEGCIKFFIRKISCAYPDRYFGRTRCDLHRSDDTGFARRLTCLVKKLSVCTYGYICNGSIRTLIRKTGLISSSWDLSFFYGKYDPFIIRLCIPYSLIPAAVFDGYTSLSSGDKEIRHKEFSLCPVSSHCGNGKSCDTDTDSRFMIRIHIGSCGYPVFFFVPVDKSDMLGHHHILPFAVSKPVIFPAQLIIKCKTLSDTLRIIVGRRTSSLCKSNVKSAVELHGKHVHGSLCREVHKLEESIIEILSLIPLNSSIRRCDDPACLCQHLPAFVIIIRIEGEVAYGLRSSRGINPCIILEEVHGFRYCLRAFLSELSLSPCRGI